MGQHSESTAGYAGSDSPAQVPAEPPIHRALSDLARTVGRLDMAVDHVRSSYCDVARSSLPSDPSAMNPPPGESTVVGQMHELTARMGYLVDQLDEFASRSELVHEPREMATTRRG